MSQRSYALALVLAAGVSLVSGCGSDDDGDGAEGVEAAAEPSDSSPTTGGEGTAPGGTDTTGPAGGAAGSADGEVDACTTLAGVDIEALVGEPVAPPESSVDMMGASCTVDPVGDSGAGLSLIVTDQSPTENFENQREVLGVDSEVDGLGDEAFHSGPYLFVLAGERLVFLQVVQDAATGAGVDDAALEATVRTVLDNLAG